MENPNSPYISSLPSDPTPIGFSAPRSSVPGLRRYYLEVALYQEDNGPQWVEAHSEEEACRMAALLYGPAADWGRISHVEWEDARTGDRRVRAVTSDGDIDSLAAAGVTDLTALSEAGNE